MLELKSRGFCLSQFLTLVAHTQGGIILNQQRHDLVQYNGCVKNLLGRELHILDQHGRVHIKYYPGHRSVAPEYRKLGLAPTAVVKASVLIKTRWAPALTSITGEKLPYSIASIFEELDYGDVEYEQIGTLNHFIPLVKPVDGARRFYEHHDSLREHYQEKADKGEVLVTDVPDLRKLSRRRVPTYCIVSTTAARMVHYTRDEELDHLLVPALIVKDHPHRYPPRRPPEDNRILFQEVAHLPHQAEPPLVANALMLARYLITDYRPRQRTPYSLTD